MRAVLETRGSPATSRCVTQNLQLFFQNRNRKQGQIPPSFSQRLSHSCILKSGTIAGPTLVSGADAHYDVDPYSNSLTLVRFPLARAYPASHPRVFAMYKKHS
eukprot:scaffold49047_cov28-Tisochrysis_lutea.AAC.1